MQEKIITRYVEEMENEVEEAFAARIRDYFDLEEIVQLVIEEHEDEICEALKCEVAALLGICPF